MKTVISAKDIVALRRSGSDLNSLPADAILTPSARDLLRDLENRGGARAVAASPSSVPAKPLHSKSPMPELEAYFHSPAARVLKEQLCDIGRRLWGRAYVDGNGGNLAIRAGDDIALCTPTLVSKGFMKPEDMCLVDFEGNQLAGDRKRTSEILMHLQIMKQQPKAVATC